MAWENLQSIVLNGNTVNLSILDTTGINWIVNATNQQFSENTSASADGSTASGIFKLTSSSDVISHNNETYDLGNEYYFQFGYYGNPYQQCSILLKKDTTTYGYATNRGTNKYPILFGIIVNHELQMAKFWGYNDNALNNNHSLSAQWVTTGSYDDFCTLLYNVVMANQPVLYEWSSVPAISGKNGILSLTMIKDDKIEEGTTSHVVLPEDNIERYTDQSNMRLICLNHLVNEWFVAAESGLNQLQLRYTLGGNNDIFVIEFKVINHYGEGNNQYYAEVYSGSIYNSPPRDGSKDAFLAFVIDEENEVAMFDPVTHLKLASSTPPVFGVDYGYLQPNDQQMAALYYFLKGSPEEIDEDDPYADGSEGDGGDGNPYQPQDHIGLSSKPTKSGLDLGIITLYKPDNTEIALISQFLWSNDVLDNFKKYFNNFADNIMSFYVLPVSPEAAAIASKPFKVGNMTSEDAGLQAVDYITDRYVDIDMGAFYLKRKWDSYLDVSPYTKLEVYLPYCGTHQLNTDEIMYPANMEGFLPVKPDQEIKLELNYRVDLVTGNIVATLLVNGENRYQFTGKCGMTIPLTGANYQNMVSGAITAGAGLAATIASGGLTAPLTASAAVSGTVMAQKPEVYRSGNLSGDVSMLAYDTPYLIKTIPNKPALDKQELYTGYPSYKKATLGSFSGYTEVIEAHIDDVSCSSEEKDKIMAALKGGVII